VNFKSKSNQICISPAAIIVFEAYVYKKENRHHYTNISHTRHRFLPQFFGGVLLLEWVARIGMAIPVYTWGPSEHILRLHDDLV
jgi:hypothetical protein